MKRILLGLAQSHPFISRKLGLGLLGFVLLTSLAFVPLFVAPPGLADPEPIGAYVNGSFPNNIQQTDIVLEPAFPNLTFNAPLSMAVLPDEDKIFIAQRDGQIFYFTDDEAVTEKTMFLDLREEVGAHFDGGFYNMVFHPNFGKPGEIGHNYFYTYYSTPSLTGAHDGPTPQRCKVDALFDGSYLVLRRYEVIEGTLQVDLSKTLDMIKIRLYNSTHRGGGMLFGNDGYLYVVVGDQAQHETAQEMEMSFDGGTLRLDVDMDPTRSHPPTYLMPKDLPRAPDEISGQGYYIPNDNPFVGWENTFEEYYTLGHRNPHRMTIDRVTGTIIIGEVGSSVHEEINIVESGANYGWPIWEGDVPRNVCISELLPNTTHKLPLVAFPRAEANSITGGYVYRGTEIPTLQGKYICGDYGGGGEIWAVDVETGEYEQIGTTIGASTKVISFGEDKDGELYVLPGGNSTALDRSNFEPLYKLKLPGGPIVPPSTLSATGAFSDLSSLTPIAGFVPYEMYESFWSDNAEKKRWMMVPNDGAHDSAGEQIEYSESGEWKFPEGTVFIKHFELPVDDRKPSITRRLETRFTIVGKDKKVYGVTYKWRPDGSDADLLDTSMDEVIPITTLSGGTRNQTWHYPSPTECLTCHNEAVGGTLGPRTRYLNTDYTYEATGVSSNQLVTLSHLGIIPESITAAEVDALPRNAAKDDNSATLEKRARSYLDLNCGYCHGPATGNRAVFDARINTPLSVSNLFSDRLNQSLGIDGERIIFPGDISRSVLFQRLHATDPNIMMPPLAKSEIDEEGSQLIAEWIGSLNSNIEGPDPDLVVEECEITNLALNKSTKQSSTYGGLSGAVSSRAVDGNTNGSWGANSIANTATVGEENAWWELDLESTYYIQGIHLWSRTGCCPDRLSDFYVISSIYPFISQDLDSTLNQEGVIVQYVGDTIDSNTVLPWQKVGRYIRIQNAGVNMIHLAEVQAMGCTLPEDPGPYCSSSNVALGKQATQSSTYPSGYSFEAGNAVDGNNNGDDAGNSMAITLSEQHAWWEVDLGKSYDLSSIKIWNRSDCCSDRLADFHVFVSQDPFDSKDLTATINQTGVCDYPFPGIPERETLFSLDQRARYVRIQLSGQNFLQLAEVEIMACEYSDNDNTPPSIPQNLLGIQTGPETWELTWDASTDNQVVAGYYIYQAGNPTPIARLGENSFLLAGLELGSIQELSVEAFDESGNSSGQSEVIQVGNFPTVTCGDAQNLALGKVTQQSSTYPGAVSSRAVDGNTNGVWSGNSIANTASTNEENAWWELDLGESYDIQELRLWPRTNCCQDRLSDFYVISSENPFISQGLEVTLFQPGVKIYYVEEIVNPNLFISWPDKARYIRIQHRGKNMLHLAELEVIGCGQDQEAPSIPQNLSSSNVNTTGLSLSWNASADNEGVAGYYIYQDGNSTPIGTLNATSFQVIGLTAGTTYQFAVAAFDAAGNVSAQSQAIQVTTEEFSTGGCTNPQNLALNKSSTQSSTYGNGLASYANDGNTSGSSPWTADLQHTSTEAQPWWEVDLGSIHEIAQVLVYNRTHNGLQRLKDFYILISETPFNPEASLTDHLANGSIQQSFFSGVAGNEVLMDLNTSGRYVRVQLSGTSILHMAEVEIWGCSEGGSDPCAINGSRNLALNKLSEQSSTYGNGIASLANDGNETGYSPWSADLQHSLNEAQPWWQVDLGSLARLENIRIVNRTGGGLGRLRDFYVLVSPTPFDNTADLNALLANTQLSRVFFSGLAGEEETLTLNGEGRFVRIQLLGTGILHMAEVEVEGCTATAQTSRFANANGNRGGKEESDSIELRIFPNPSSGRVTFSIGPLKIGASVEYSLYNLQGRRVWLKMGSRTEQVNLDNLAKGVYLLKIQAGEWSEVKQLVIN